MGREAPRREWIVTLDGAPLSAARAGRVVAWPTPSSTPCANLRPRERLAREQVPRLEEARRQRHGSIWSAPIRPGSPGSARLQVRPDRPRAAPRGTERAASCRRVRLRPAPSQRRIRIRGDCHVDDNDDGSPGTTCVQRKTSSPAASSDATGSAPRISMACIHKAGWTTVNTLTTLRYGLRSTKSKRIGRETCSGFPKSGCALSATKPGSGPVKIAPPEPAVEVAPL